MIENKSKVYFNDLVNESSPYLLQHAHNPVNWYPWNEKTLEMAVKSDKLLLISIGYSACHWCHVMENESFMDEEVASIMNENFICIKVDREEHPDVDHAYMDAVQIINGNGGWPLNCFALADGRPFWGGTYFPKEQWKEVMQQIIQLKAKTPYKLSEQALLIKKGIQENNSPLVLHFDKDKKVNIEKYYDTISYQLDNINGGTINAPKFPMPVLYQFLLCYNFYHKNIEVYNHINLTLNKMAKGGIFDQIGGGFARYATDVNWKIPHFEKMLYDNVQLVSLYANAYRSDNKPFYKNIALACLQFIERELKAENGLYYSALDADSEGVEGKYYIWTKSEIDEILKNDSDFFCTFYNVSETGNWEHNQNILYRTDNLIANKIYDQPETDLLETLKLKLLNGREKRIKPLLDDKIIVSWNALTICALIDAFFAFEQTEFYQTARKNATYLINNYFSEDGKLLRIKDKKSKTIYGLLDDYANFINALLLLYQADADELWLQKSKELIDFCIKHFYNEERGLFYYTADFDNKLFVRNTELIDNVIPSSNSVLLNSMYTASKILDNADYMIIVKKAVQLMLPQIETYPSAYANWINLIIKLNKSNYILTVVGEKSNLFANKLHSFYLPNVIILHTINESPLMQFKDRYVKDKTLIYICTDIACHEAIDNVDDAVKYINERS